MMNMTRAGHGAAVLLASLLTGAAEAARWEQRPDPLPGTNQFNGWAEYAVASDTQIVADAWVNTAGGTIAHFTWWGCFLDWRETNAPPEPPGSFRFAMWMNDAGEALDFPRPAGVSWSAATTNWSATFVGFTQDPRGGDVVTNAVFRFEADLESGQAFDVDGFPGVSNWWLSVFAHYPDSISTNPFGWLVRPAVAASPATSGALRVFSPSNPSGGDGYGAGAPIQHPTGTPWHATFELPGPVAADFGDAPDSNNDLSAPMDAYGPATPALFPTIFRAGQQPTGPRHGSPLSPVRLGTAVSTEAAADSGTDQDGLNNLAPASGQSNQDGGDDGLVLPPTLTAGPGAQVRYVVTAASPWSGYLNLWCDWNRDGDWDDEVVDGVVTAREWAVRNAAVSLGAGVFTNLSPAFAAAHPVATSQLWMRISLAEAPAPVVAGPAGGGSGPADGYSYGETEDHFITTFLQATEDFGDAPAGYPVTLAQDGARHTVGAGLFLGAGVDREADGAPSPAANGDDLAGLDDEDGVTFAGAWAPGQNAAVEIVASAAGFVSAWADFNRNTNWTDSGELWLTGQAVTAGLNHVTVAVPAGLAGGFVAVRVRCATSALFISTPAGAAPDGEVEDYRVLVSGQDFGDAPATFPTALAADGARHEVVPGMQLGALIDAEADGQPGAAATGDDLADLADEDGVLVTGPLAAGTIVTVRVTVASSGYLGAWIDWNRDGDWDLPAERVIVTQALGAGVTDLPVSVPADAAAGTAIARFRFAGVAAEVELPTGAALDGEVEDYALTVSGAGAATAGDYGDAPDAVNQAGTNMTAYAGGGSAGFPTTYSEGASPNGPLHRQPGAGLWLGAAVSIEQAADHDLDADGTNNLVPAADQANLDGGDDGLLAPLALPSLGTASVAFVITSTNAGPVSGFANLWFDWNRDGDWNDELVQGGVTAAEWAVRNQPVSLAGPGNQTVTSLAFVAWHPQPGVVTALWARLSVASEPAPTVTESGPRRGGGGPANGYAAGETEDYLITAYADGGVDFGDAPGGLPTTLAADGARHIIAPGVRLGAALDAESDGQPAAGAAGDDVAGLDDEDGLTLPAALVVGRVSTVQVSVSVSGYLSAWCDWNHNGVWEAPQEQLALQQPVAAGLVALAVGVPADATVGVAVARLRFSTGTAGLGAPTGLAPDGEVEDHALPVVSAADYYRGDYGDAADSANGPALPMLAYAPAVTGWFPTVFVEGQAPTGPWHRSPRGGAWLGPQVSFESGVDQAADEDGLNNLNPAAGTADHDGADDGLLQPLYLPAHGTGRVAYVLSTTNAGPQNVYVNLWCDWNRDGDWADTLEVAGRLFPEWAVQNELVALPGPGTYTNLSPGFAVWSPAPGVATALWMRLSLAGEAAALAGEPGPRQGGMGPAGGYATGETEDYRVTSYVDDGVDFGDAPTNYLTQVGQGGAAHLIVPGVQLGEAVDAEADGQPAADLLGDDAAGADDEDGVALVSPILAGAAVSLQVVASTDGFVSVWADWNDDGDWGDALEQAALATAVSPGTNLLSITAAASLPAQRLVARVRFSTQASGVAAPDGLAPDGEVEDHAFPLAAFDFGDAPTNYPTRLSQDGARHAVVEGVRLGAGLDSEPDGQPAALADGDDLAGVNDEDGVALLTALSAGQSVTVRVNSSASGFVGAWVDWNGDGDWADAQEHVLAAAAVPGGATDLAFAAPASIGPAAVIGRFRFATQAGDVAAPTGVAADGEVEDHRLPVTGFDFGDAPTSFPVRLDQDGARHARVPGTQLGLTVDAESDGAPGWNADGDDSAGLDDEDGVTLVNPLVAGSDVTVRVACATSGFLSAWLDWNGDGDWADAGEQPLAAVAVTAGPNDFDLATPPALAGLRVIARFRFATQAGQVAGPTGAADDGEVEDHALPIAGFDFGDAPAPYPTLLADDGARHAVVPGVRLGALSDGEAEGQPAAGATGDDAAGVDDEDGVTLLNTLAAGQAVTARVEASVSGYVSAWLDWNGDGDWADAGEQVAAGVSIPGGVQDLVFTAPTSLPPAGVMARFRYATQAEQVVAPTGVAADGEVEDHFFAADASDYGDAPTNYPTRLSQNGARHFIVSGVRLGALIDGEPDGQPSAGLDADDLAGGDDEDGVVLIAPLVAGQTTTARVTASVSGFVSAWLDWNGDGDWVDAGEQVFDRIGAVAGANDYALTVPANALASPVRARFRFATQMDDVAAFTGSAADGEVEDHAFVLAGLDFGDAPAPYGTLLIHDGARHRVLPGVYLGAGVDQEADGLPSAPADGDDLMATDDEDGVTVVAPLLAGQVATARVVASVSGFVSAWVDWNGDADWADAGEAIVVDQLIAAGTNDVAFGVPPVVTGAQVIARFRFCTQIGPAASPGGYAPDGEVEDHRLTVDRLDYGDAPDSYGTTRAQDGARHAIRSGVHLGAGLDEDADGQPTVDALGDDQAGLDDEDGVVFPPLLLLGQVATAQVTASTSGFVSAWLDLNGNGSWAEAGEQVWTSVAVQAGANLLALDIPTNAAPGAMLLRVRFATAADAVPGPTGFAPDGEVEDYRGLVGALDFGDAPAGYPVGLAQDGARHAGPTALWLGAQFDGEADGVNSIGADADDVAGGPDDEDGVGFPEPPRSGFSTPISVTASAGGRVNLWLDLDRNQSWGEVGEHLLVDEPVTAGVNHLTLTLPAGLEPGTRVGRIRLASQAGLGVTGLALDGEVEDYLVGIEDSFAPDFGDAPSTFPVTLVQNGARHLPVGPLWLGATRDVEAEGQPHPDALGDDANGSPDDEDGVTFVTAWVRGVTGQVSVVSTTNGLLSAWVDFNRDGQWNSVGERVIDNQSVVAGANLFAVPVPLDALVGPAVARFRVSSAGGLDITGDAADGEVEDHVVTLAQAITLLDPLGITNITRQAGGMRVGITSTDDVYLELQGTTNLGSVSTTWSPVGPLVRGPAPYLTDPAVPSTQKAYRVVIPYAQ